MPVVSGLRISCNPSIPEACAYLEDPESYVGNRIFDIELPIAENRIKDEAHQLAMAGIGALFDVKAVFTEEDYGHAYDTYQKAVAAGIWAGYKIASKMLVTEEVVA